MLAALTHAALLLPSSTDVVRTPRIVASEDGGKPILLAELLSTCVDAAERGCREIRRVNTALQRSRDGAIQEVDYKIDGDPRSALTAADLAAPDPEVNRTRQLRATTHMHKGGGCDCDCDCEWAESAHER